MKCLFSTCLQLVACGRNWDQSIVHYHDNNNLKVLLFTLYTYSLQSQWPGAVGSPLVSPADACNLCCFFILSMSTLFTISFLKITRSSSGLFFFSSSNFALKSMSSCLSLVVLSKDRPTFLNSSLFLRLLAFF